jgi:alkylation response protein AidB-like acyl-CoA dehydrogenase
LMCDFLHVKRGNGMEFHFTQEEDQFRSEIRQFLANNLPPDWDGTSIDEEDAAAITRSFTRKLAARGWLAMAWPKEYGGQAAGHIRQLIYNEEMAYHLAPGAFNMGVAWVGPAIMLYGTDEQKQRYLPRIARGEDIWCTLYSEPAAGSDLAALQTRAVLEGDEFVINGHKIWTSGAHIADWGWLAARTDLDAPKHKGISTFVVNMKTPGITVRPLINMAGEHGFNEVFFDDVRIPKENLVGELNRGWYHIAVALDFERSGIQSYAIARRTLQDLASLVRNHRSTLLNLPTARLGLAERVIELNVGTLLAYRVAWMQSHGKVPNYEASMSKLLGSELTQRIAQTGMVIIGMCGQLMPGSLRAPLSGRYALAYLRAVSSTIAAGTSEIQRNIIATRGLGLPRG